MTPKEALEELGLGSDATASDVHAAYYRRAKQTHPDSNPHDPEAAQKFQRVNEAHEFLKGLYERLARKRGQGAGRERDATDHAEAEGSSDRGPGQNRDGNHARADDQHPETTDPEELVRQRMQQKEIVVLADGFLEVRSHIKRPTTSAEFQQYLLQPDVTTDWLIDDIMLDVPLRERIGGRTLVTAAVRKVIAAAAKARSGEIFRPITRTLGPEGYRTMLEKLTELVALVFIGPSHLLALGLLQYIWQVHRRGFGYDVAHPIMPVIWSAEQGTGKTEFVRHFCAPLQELFSPPIAFGDFIDPRFSSALDYYSLFLDEIPQLTPLQVDLAKPILSGAELLRRQLGSPKRLRIRLRSSAIGTSNGPVERYFPDPSGHRRILSLEHRDGRTGPEIWDAVDAFDFERVWRMVNATGPAPILPVLGELRAYQVRHAPKSPLLIWLLGLDVNADEMKNMRMNDGFQSTKLRMLFNDTCGLDWSRARFKAEMQQFFDHPLTPFGGMRDVHGLTYYRLKS